MILTETRYKTHNSKLLTIAEVLKTWKYYLKSYKYEVLVLTNHNNFQHFMDTKNLNFKQVC